MRAAVLVIIFNRPDLAQQAIEHLRPAKPMRVYVAGDGPRPDRVNEADLCASARKAAINAIDWPCEVYTNFQDRNLATRIHVSSAIDWFFEHEPEGLIMEDDCLADPSFFTFCDELLERYRDDCSVSSICGTSYLRSNLVYPYSYYPTQFPDIWGWATWRDRWQQMDLAMDHWPTWRKNGGLRTIRGRSPRFTSYWNKIFEKTRNAEINSWGYAWIATRWRLGGISLQPTHPLVTNAGYRSDATNTLDKTLPPYVRPTREIRFPLRHPPALEVSAKIDRHIWKFRYGLSWVHDILYILKAPLRPIRDAILKRK
jgi:hypothetical protein